MVRKPASESSAEPSPCAACDNHVVQFYESEAFLFDAIAEFLAPGLAAGQPIVVIARSERRAGIGARLALRGHDLDRAERSGDVVLLDADAALEGFMVDGLPDEHLFRETIGAVIAQRGRRNPGAGVRAYGEMVDVLWCNGNPAGAIRLEELWNELSHTHAFSLLCAYAMGNFYSAAHAEQLRRICDAHARVIPTESYSAAPDEDALRLREVALLQQRALALETEIEHRKRLEKALRNALAERRRSEQALRTAKEAAERAYRIKTEFLAVMSHELRTPLNSVIGYGDLLEHEVAGPLTTEQKLYLARISTGAEQLLGLIDQVLSLSRLEAGKEELLVERVEVAAMVREAVSMVHPTLTRKRLGIEIHTEEALYIDTDAGKLRQILLNLLSNAVKFTAKGEIRVESGASDGALCVTIRDTGPGIRPEDLGRIFDAFVQVDGSPTRRHGGTGLGLSVSRDLARLLGGELTVTSTFGVGSAFTLRLPLGVATAPDAVQVAAEA